MALSDIHCLEHDFDGDLAGNVFLLVDDDDDDDDEGK